MYWYAKFPVPASACPSSVCQKYSANLTLRIQNNKFIKDVRNKVMAYAVYDGYSATQIYSQGLQIYSSLQPINLSVSRSNNNAGVNTNISVTTVLRENHGDITILLEKSVLSSIQSAVCSQQSNPSIVSSTLYMESLVQISVQTYAINQSL